MKKRVSFSKEVASSKKDSFLPLSDAINSVKKSSLDKKRNFSESIDVSINLGIDPKQSDQSVRGFSILPNGSGKKIRAIVFVADPKKKELAISLGAKMAGLEDLISKIEEGFLDFDCCIATPEAMPKISKIAKKLGPRGLMPSPKNGTVTNDIKEALSSALGGRVDFKNDKSGILHCSFGRVNFDTPSLVDNFTALLKAVKSLKPESSKGKFIKSVYINSTMGESFKVLAGDI